MDNLSLLENEVAIALATIQSPIILAARSDDIDQEMLDSQRQDMLDNQDMLENQEQGMLDNQDQDMLDNQDHDDQITMSIGSTPFFLESDDTDVAAEVEVETTVNDENESQDHQINTNEMMPSCQLILSPITPASVSPSHTEQNHCMSSLPGCSYTPNGVEIIAKFPRSHTSEYGFDSDESCHHVVGELDGSTTVSRSSSTSSDRGVVESIDGDACGNDKTRSGVSDERAFCTAEIQSTTVPILNKDMVNRASCIQWAGKNVAADPTFHARSDSNSPVTVPIFVRRLHETVLMTSRPSGSIRKTAKLDKPGCSKASASVHPNNLIQPHVKTFENQLVRLAEAQRNQQVVMPNHQVSCCHPCCIMMRELVACLPLWMNTLQLQSYVMSQFASGQLMKPPGFEDPPESEWPTVNVYHIDPSDGTLRYKCRSCHGVVEQRSTKQKNHLNIDRLKHECEQCHRKYITKKQLKMHSLRHNEKTRVCNVCDKRFLTQGELQNHLNTHTRQKPYGCPICNQTFAHSSRYYTHLRSYHKKYDCEACFYKVCSSTKSFKSCAAAAHKIKHS